MAEKKPSRESATITTTMGASTTVQDRLFDAVLGVAVFGTVAGMMSANLGSDRGPDAITYLWALILGCLMLVRRSYSLVVLWVTVFGLFAYYAADYPVIGLSVPAAAALFSAAEFRKPRWPVAAAAVLLVIGYGARLLQGQDVALVVGYELANDVLLMAAAIALGISLRLRRRLRESSRRLIWVSAERERSQALAASASERADIARELHDALGHQSMIISMHADIARESLESDTETTRDAIAVIKETGKAMTGDLRRTVRTLRQKSDQGERAPARLASLEESLFPRLPITVRARIDVADQLPRYVETAAYRIVQEALTNVIKHSASESAEVLVSAADGRLEITVSDPGPARGGGAERGPGFGIHGMKERVASLDGELTAGTEGGGFVIRARLPLPPEHVDGEDGHYSTSVDPSGGDR